VWLACTLSFILGLPSLGSSVAFSAATSIATIGLYTSYGMSRLTPQSHSTHSHFKTITVGLPIALRVIYADRFVRGPFHLGSLSYPIATAAVLWIAFICIVFCLPELNPVNAQTLNYAPVAVGIVLAYALGFWAVSARKWFAGPIKQIAGALRPRYSLSTVVCVNADDKRLICTEEGKDIDLADSEPAVMIEKPEFSEKSSGS
jgi:hypothetical protein